MTLIGHSNIHVWSEGMTVLIFRRMELYPEKMDGTPHHVCSALCNVYRPFCRGIHPSIEKLLQLLPNI